MLEEINAERRGMGLKMNEKIVFLMKLEKKFMKARIRLREYVFDDKWINFNIWE